MNDELFRKIIAAVRRFDALDLLASVAALQLIPANVSSTVRLEVLAHAIATHHVQRTGKKAAGGTLQRLTNTEPLADFAIVRREDPPEWHFTAPLAWRGQPCIVFPGISDDALFTFHQLTRAVDIAPESHPYSEFLFEIHRTITAVLRLSSELARRAGMSRWTRAEFKGRHTTVPATPELDRLRRCVLFDRSELDQLLSDVGGSAVLASLTVECGSVGPSYDQHTGALLAKPIVRDGDTHVIALPGLLLEAARHSILSSASVAGTLEEIGERYCEAVWTATADSTRKLGMDRVSQVARLSDIPNSRAALYQFDTDKWAQVMLITDPFSNYRAEIIFDQWPLDQLGRRISERAVEAAARAQQQGINDLTTLIVVQGAGREHFVRLERDLAHTLVLRAAEFETFGYVEGGQPLALWKYLQDHTRLSNTTQIQAASFLDEYELYRSRKHTFYIGDERPPDGLMVEVGTGLGAREYVASRYDPHWEPTEESGDADFVVKMLYADVPVYGDLDRASDRVACFVDGAALPIWILGPEYGREDTRALRSLCYDVVQGVAYWLWQVTPGLNRHLTRTAPLVPLKINIQISPNVLDSAQHNSGQQPFNSAVEGSTATVRFNPAAVPLFLGVDNAGERGLLSEILMAVGQTPSAVDLDAASVAQLVDQFAPLGPKKQMFFLQIDRAPDLDDVDLGAERLLQNRDTDCLLDDLGEHLRTIKARSTGPIEGIDDRRTVLNECVGFFYELLREEVARLDSVGPLEALVRRHEALVQQTAYRSLTVPTRLACYRDVPEVAKDIASEIPERSRTALASRFLIEFVATQPPNGTRPLSDATYDRLLAISHHIINFGFSSDLLHFGLADTHLSILGSGRLGIERDAFSEGLKAYMAAYTSDVARRSLREFPRHWRRGAGDGPTGVLERFAEASTAEFGATLAEFFDVMIAAVDIPRLSRYSVGVLPRAELVDQITETLSWPTEKVAAIIDQLTMVPRRDFLVPSAPFKPRDVYPWKFGRALSYLRRPFLQVRQDGDERLMWGFRHLFHATGYLGMICVQGRLVATSPEMRTAISEMNDVRGDQFTDEIAKLIERPGRIVRVRISDFREVRMPLERGDIDVLTVDQATKTLTAIECKDLALARTPQELANQLEGLMRGADDTEGRTVTRHGKRLIWIRQNLPAVLRYFNVGDPDKWTVRGIFVVDEPLFVAHLRNIGMEVVSLESLHEEGL
jgi:hypothetical protein